MTAQGLIDTTEMYLRTIFELEEEGVVPLRARIAEVQSEHKRRAAKLHQAWELTKEALAL